MATSTTNIHRIIITKNILGSKEEQEEEELEVEGPLKHSGWAEKKTLG